ncbi:DUF6944 family repetitive protein [Psychrobacillus sp. FSL K6-1267]|uniref:DUF6944 family repetitive protein n=1 Tax=Psychrobacillus sp. FSL K6-1267 TaxID=2921543 RepID=UPI0030F92484
MWKNENHYSPISNNTYQIHNSTKSSSYNTAITGGWIEAIGTIVAAIGNTPSKVLSKSMLKDFRLIGNVLQASGSALVADNEELLLDIVGDQLQAIGNVTVVAGILASNEQSSQRLLTQGNLLQILGTGVSINTQENLSFIQTIDNIGNIIQAIGNTIQVFANTSTEEGINMNALGVWIQAGGTVITALASDYDN